MNNYRIESYTFPELKNVMRLPNYQRPLVWSNDQKMRFVDNISKGFPFGSLLLYKYESGEAFTLIDGQQRYTTLKEYMHSPERFFPLEDSNFINELMIASGASEQSEESQADLHTKFVSITKDMIRLKASGERLDNSYLAKNIREIFPIAGQSQTRMMEIVDIQGELLDALDNYIDLETLQVPCIIFIGDKSDLPEVFANVNLGGRKLTKYQVFAAQWDRYSVSLENSELSNQILNKTIDRYERLTLDRGGLVIEDFSPEEMRRNRKVTLPELCHALGEIIIETCQACWPKKSIDSDDTVDTIGYNTLAIVFGIHPKDISILPEKFASADFENDPSAIEQMLKDVIREYKEINERFAKYLRRPGTDQKYETSKTSGQLQFLSFFAALWRIRYGAISSVSYEALPGYKHKGYEDTCKNLFPSFLHDMLSNQWKGSGDTRLGNYISGALNYRMPVGRDKLFVAMSSYLEDQKESESINVDPVTKTLLTVFSNIHKDDYQESTYDYEHLIPRDTLNKRHNGKQAYKAFKISGGGLGNIANLDSGTNRGKQSKTLIDAMGELFSCDGKREDVDLDALKQANLDLLDGKPEAAKSFIENRAKQIGQQIVDYIIKD